MYPQDICILNVMYSSGLILKKTQQNPKVITVQINDGNKK